MTATTPLRGVTVTKALKAAGFRQSEYLASSRVRGWGSSTEGFETQTEYRTEYIHYKKYHYTQARGSHQVNAIKEKNTPTGKVFVSYQQSTNISAKHDAEKQVSKLNALETALKGMGFKVTRETYGWNNNQQRLVVERAEV